jgi:hypothetical protein
MKHIPNHLHMLSIGSFHHRGKGRKIKRARSFNQRPARPITYGTDVETSQQFIITGHLTIVLCALQHIQAPPRPVNVTGRLKTCQEKRIK